MPQSAYQEFPTRSLSLADSNALCKYFHDRSMENELLHFVLSGKFQDTDEAGNDDIYQAVIDPLRNIVHDDHPLEVMRDYDSVIGIAFDIAITAPLTVYPVAMDYATVTKSIHINYTLHGEDGSNETVPVHRIPNVELGFWNQRHMIHMFFPSLYNDDRTSSILTRDEKETFYNCGLHPAIMTLIPFDTTEWPPTYSAEMFRAAKKSGGSSPQTKMIPAYAVSQLAEAIRSSLSDMDIPWFQNAFVTHTIRGTKSSTRHEKNAESASLTLEEFLTESDLDSDKMADGSWYIDVGLDIKSSRNECLQWYTQAHAHIVENALEISPDAAARITSMNSTKYSRDLSSHLTSVSGCRIEPGSTARGRYEAVYLQMYTTDKSVTYHPHGRHHAKALTMKEAMDKEQPVPFLSGLYKTYIDASQTISSNARIEVRVPFRWATSVLLGIPGPALRHGLLSFTMQDWWNFRAFRALAIGKLFCLQAGGPSKFRVRKEALLLTAAAVWLVNSLHARPDDHRSSRALMKCVLRLTESDTDPNLVPYKIRNRVQEDDSDTSDSDSDDYQVPYNPYGAIFLRPLMIDPDVPRMRVANIAFLDHKSFHFIFGATLQDIEHKYNPIGIIPPHQLSSSAIVQNKRKTKQRLPAPDGDELGTIFNLGNRGYMLAPPPRDTGSDVEEDEDGTDADENSIDAVMTRLWRQFLSDIAQKTPNIRGSSCKSYFKLTQSERESIAEDVFRSLDLSVFWTAVQWRAAKEKEWNSSFNNLFPPRDHVVSAKVQNYVQCTYYKEWKRISIEANEATVKAMRKSLRQKLFALSWIPHACSDKLWSTGKKDGFKILPETWKTAAPRILLKANKEPEWNSVQSSDESDDEDIDVE